MRRGGFVNTGNYEPDGWCWSVLLAHGLWRSSVAPTDAHATATATTSGGAFKPAAPPPAAFDSAFKLALERMIVQFTLEQDHEDSLYRYVQTDGGKCKKGVCEATGKPCGHAGDAKCAPDPALLPRAGLGNATNYTGMTWVGFRPSDDASARFNVPVNALVATAMRQSAELCREVYGDAVLATLAERLAGDIEDGIAKFGTVQAPGGGAGEMIYAYETDGLGNTSILDDANAPSLLSLPYFGFKGDAAIMANTRKWVLSASNPWYKTGKCATGVGSEHTGGNKIWPMALIAQAITSANDTEVGSLLQMLLNSDCDSGYMHESFDANNGCNFTREYFAWPNAFFAELIDELQSAGRLTAKVLSLPRERCGAPKQ
jgi:meiotically up-regulated gene 157 (Mug157) protein